MNTIDVDSIRIQTGSSVKRPQSTMYVLCMLASSHEGFQALSLLSTGDVRPIYESLCHSLAVDLHDRMEEEEMEDGHLVTDECGHWTVRRLLALADKDNNAGMRVGGVSVQCGRS